VVATGSAGHPKLNPAILVARRFCAGPDVIDAMEGVVTLVLGPDCEPVADAEEGEWLLLGDSRGSSSGFLSSSNPGDGRDGYGPPSVASLALMQAFFHIL